MYMHQTTRETHVATDMFMQWFTRSRAEPSDIENTMKYFPALVYWVLQYHEFRNPDPVPPRVREVRTVVGEDGKEQKFVL